MNQPKFPLGQIVATAGVAARMEEYPTFQTGVMQSLHRHSQCDWGDMDAEDCQTNEAALVYGSRVMSDYTIDGIRIWIITEADRSATTILFPDEY